MIIKELLFQLKSSSYPVAKILQKSEHHKVLIIGFKKGMILKEHKTNFPSKLIVLNGALFYKQNKLHKHLLQYDETDIPVNCLHSVECIEDAICLLAQG
jgi:quercetin dioxygenase-like cupin family protein